MLDETYEKRFSLSPHLLKEFLHLIATSLFVLDESGQILFANRYAHQMFKSDNLEGRSFKEFFSAEDQNILYRNILYLAKKEGFYEREVLFLPAYGEPFMAHITINKFVSEGRVFLLVTCQDISELKTLERSMREARHLVFLGRMLTDMSHQVRNPILVIGGLVKRLQENPSKLPAYASAIMYQCDRLEKLLKALEEFVNLPRPRFAPVAIKDVLKCLSHKFRLEILGDVPELRLELSPGMEEVTFFTDLYLLTQALSHIIQNALEAHQEKGTNESVEVKCWLSDKKVIFEVLDWGEGIPKETLAFLTNPFFSTKPGHLGMGLTLSQRIIEELDGTLEVINLKDPTAIRISFPIDRRRPERKHLLT